MAEGRACLLDSNILLRISKSDDPQHLVVTQALKTLVAKGVRLCYTHRPWQNFGTPQRDLSIRTVLG